MATEHKPNAWNAVFELRALIEAVGLIPYWQVAKQKTSGDGQPVMVLPGFLTSDAGTFVLRNFLRMKGFEPLPWENGRNPGLQQVIFDKLLEQVDTHYARFGQKISLVGWSLGGIYARALAHKRSDKIKQVITLGSPFGVSTNLNAGDVDVSENILKLYERLNPDADHDPLLNGDAFWQEIPPVPSTAIYSKTDGVTSWEYCVDNIDTSFNENINIFSSHLGLTHNPRVFHLIADRLGQNEKNWQPYATTQANKNKFSRCFSRKKYR